ncbi:hypothetical protein MUP46_04320 [Patescibacteria group bacterium]|nr:hypothetical protein [Patescibacteria group bacterium]
MTLYRTIYSQKKAGFCKAHSKEILDMVHADPKYVEYKANQAKTKKATTKKEAVAEPEKEGKSTENNKKLLNS